MILSSDAIGSPSRRSDVNVQGSAKEARHLTVCF
jgi:hypothetical protein